MATLIEYTKNPRVRRVWGPGLMARLRTYQQAPSAFRGYGQDAERQLLATVEGLYDTEEEATVGAESIARRMRANGIYVEDYYPVLQDDGQWAAMIEHEEPAEEPVIIIEGPKPKSALRYLLPIGFGVAIFGAIGYGATHKKKR